MGYTEALINNFNVVTKELKTWRRKMAVDFVLLKDATMHLGKTNVFYLLSNFIEETFYALPRTLTYLVILSAVGWSIAKLANVVL